VRTNPLLPALLALSAALLLPRSTAAADTSPTPEATRPLFAFDNGVGRGQWKPDEQARLLKELGYAGIGYTGTQQIPEMLKALDARGLKLLSIYVNAHVDSGKPPYDPGLKTAIEQLRGRDTLIFLFITGRKASYGKKDDRAAALVREIADAAEQSHLRVALYPHTGFYVARLEDALRLIKMSDRKNVGVCFNLCHFLKTDDERNIERQLRAAGRWLFAVNINGADSGQTNKMGWDRLIQPLDRGSFELGGLLKTLKSLDYRGPIGLQCYALGGDPRDNLRRSMDAWRKLATPQ
jgi:sugar phosphate isomerase/epimerase